MTESRLYARILVPTDGSTAAEYAIDHAVTIARDNDAAIHALYVVDSRITVAARDRTRSELEASLEADGRDAVDHVVKRAESHGISTESQIRRGTPSKEILEYVDTEGIDLVVMGSAGKSPREKLIRMGSVSERVVEKSNVPVLIIPDGAGAT